MNGIMIFCTVCCALMLVWVGYLLLRIRGMEKRFDSSREYLESRIGDLEKAMKNRADQLEHYMDSRYDLVKDEQEFMYNKIEDVEKIIDDQSASINRQAVNIAGIQTDIEQNKNYMNSNVGSLWRNSEALGRRIEALTNDVRIFKAGSKEADAV